MTRRHTDLTGLAAVSDAADQLDGLRAELVALVREATLSHDGYPRRSISGQHGVTNEVEPLLDADGVPLIDALTHRPIMVPVPQRSDPVAQTVIDRQEMPLRSEEAAVLRKVDRLIDAARADLDAAVRIARTATEGKPAPPDNPDGQWCTVHLGVRPTPMHESVTTKAPKSGLCWFCYGWDLEYRHLLAAGLLPHGWPAKPPAQLLVRRASVKHVTVNLLHEVLDSLVGAQAVTDWIRGRERLRNASAVSS